MTNREFHCIAGTSKKFWRIHGPVQFNGKWLVTVHFGRIGTEGQTRTKVFPMEFAAHDDIANRCGQKLDKGYKEKPMFPGLPVPGLMAAEDNAVAYWKAKKKKAKKKVVHAVEVVGKPDPVVEKKVRRFINLNWRKTA